MTETTLKTTKKNKTATANYELAVMDIFNNSQEEMEVILYGHELRAWGGYTSLLIIVVLSVHGLRTFLQGRGW